MTAKHKHCACVAGVTAELTALRAAAARTSVETARAAHHQPVSERPWQEQSDLDAVECDARDALAVLLGMEQWG